MEVRRSAPDTYAVAVLPEPSEASIYEANSGTDMELPLGYDAGNTPYNSTADLEVARRL